jgi:hypothetical protein
MGDRDEKRGVRRTGRHQQSCRKERDPPDGLYADVLKPSGFEDMLNVSLRPLAARGGVGGFGFGLSERAADRTDESLRRSV